MPTTAFFMPSSGHRKSNAKLKPTVPPSKGATANLAPALMTPALIRAAYASFSFAAPVASLSLGWLWAGLLKLWKAAARRGLKTELSKRIFSGALSTYINAMFMWNREHGFFTAWRVRRKLQGLMKQTINNSSLYTQKISHLFPEEVDTTECLGERSWLLCRADHLWGGQAMHRQDLRDGAWTWSYFQPSFWFTSRNTQIGTDFCM